MRLDDALDMTVLSADYEVVDNNEASIVLKVVYDNVSILLTGHTEMDEQANLAEFRKVCKTAERKRRDCQ